MAKLQMDRTGMGGRQSRVDYAIDNRSLLICVNSGAP